MVISGRKLVISIYVSGCVLLMVGLCSVSFSVVFVSVVCVSGFECNGFVSVMW